MNPTTNTPTPKALCVRLRNAIDTTIDALREHGLSAIDIEYAGAMGELQYVRAIVDPGINIPADCEQRVRARQLVGAMRDQLDRPDFVCESFEGTLRVDAARRTVQVRHDQDLRVTHREVRTFAMDGAA